MPSKATQITVTTTEVFEVAGDREAQIIAAYANDTQDLYPNSGSWMISDLPQVGQSKYEVTVQ